MCKADCAAYVRLNTSHIQARRLERIGAYAHTIHIIGCYMGLPRVRFYLTEFYVRRSYYYIATRYPHGQTRTTRPEDAGAEAHWHAQSTFRYRYRSSLQREPVLRFQGSAPSPLRDVATPYRREHVDSQCRSGVWGLAADILSSASGFRPIWTRWLTALSARPERWAQGDRRSSGLRGKFAGGRPLPDYCSVCASRSAAVWDYNPPAQSRAGAEQKKTASQDLKSCLRDNAVAAYETLRLHLIDPADQLGSATGRVVLLRRGMLAWARTDNHVQASPGSLCQTGGPPVPSGVATELVQVMAGLILGRGKDTCHA
jgi:hypothetical protein